MPEQSLMMRVAAKERASDGVVTLTLRRPNGARLPDWAPGAHVDLMLPGGTRQYSLCGDRWDAHSYRVGVLREPHGKGGSAYVHDELAEGDLVPLGGPRNHFAMVPAARYLFIAGGIGITPLLPMLVQADRVGADWRLVYGGRSRSTMAFIDELAVWGDRVRVVPVDEAGPLDLPALLPATQLSRGPSGPTVADTRVYVCGPAGLLDAVESRCAGWEPGRLRMERFVAREQGAPVRDDPFEVELVRSGLSVTVDPDVTVLDAVQAAGVPVLSSCRTGTCGTCETPVLAGRPDHRDSILTDDERTASDVMFPCVSRSCGPSLTLDL